MIIFNVCLGTPLKEIWESPRVNENFCLCQFDSWYYCYEDFPLKFCTYNLTRQFPGEHFILMKEMFQTYVLVKNLECPGRCLSCSLSLLWYASYWEFKHWFHCYPLRKFLFKEVRDKGSLKVDEYFCQDVIDKRDDVEHYYILQPCFRLLHRTEFEFIPPAKKMIRFPFFHTLDKNITSRQQNVTMKFWRLILFFSEDV